MYIYISCDIETTGLDSDKDQILELGAIFDILGPEKDEVPFIGDLPTLRLLLAHNRLEGHRKALIMNSNILEETDRRIEDEGICRNFKEAKTRTFDRVIYPDYGAHYFRKWIDYCFSIYSEKLNPNDRITLNFSGKNFGTFDKLFLEGLKDWAYHINIRHRVLDVGSLYFNPFTDSELPNLQLCKKRAGFKETEVTHNAVEDAMDVVKLIRLYYGYPTE